MARLVAFALALALSLGLYVGVFSIVKRPLTVGDVAAMIETKQAYARSLPSPKIVVFAGSNGRYSHRCETIAAVTGRPCANLSVAVGIGLDVQFGLIDGLLQPGDLLYLPLEYAQYAVGRAEMEGGTENVLLVQYLPGLLEAQAPLRILRAWGSFDLPFLVHGLIETGLASRSFTRRTNVGSLTAHGDESGHTASKAEPYQAFLQATRHREPTIAADTHADAVISAFVRRVGARGVRVVGGLPTLPIQAEVPAVTQAHVRALFERERVPLLMLESGSRYPLECFYDTHSHLHEACQIAHSRSVGEALRAWLARPPSP